MQSPAIVRVLGLFGMLGACALSGAAPELGSEAGTLSFLRWAERPPLGWNSWDCFGTTVTEAQTREHADYMAAHLARFGWEYVVVDIQWYEPRADGFAYRDGAALTMDGWGRLLPAENRFPSAAGGVGFRALADHVHAKGLKFGIHLMRGIPRQAVAANLPILGTDRHAADIADRERVCSWNPDMYGVDMSKPGAQEYYDSVFALIASWGVDYVKVDDLSRPYHANQAEVEAIRRAIDRTGRPMVLSLSPGETALTAAEHVKTHANLWRISDDFWDNWPALLEQFGRLEKWNPHRGPGHWPDADMLPLGVLERGKRTTQFTPDEQRTMLTLWCIARSPLMIGADLTKLDAATLALLTNPEVLAVNQSSLGNRPLFSRDGLVGWVAGVPGSTDKYLALFNTRDRISLPPERAAYRSAVVNVHTSGRKVAIAADLAGADKLFLIIDDGDDGAGWDHALWIAPRLVMVDGSERRLTQIPWVRATTGWGVVSTTVAPSGKPMAVAGQPVPDAIAAHARSMIEFDLPAGAQRFLAEGAVDDAVTAHPDGGTVSFRVQTMKAADLPTGTGEAVPVDLAELGFSGPVSVRDLWTGAELGTSTRTFAPELAWHGSGLYRLTPARP
jgi:hypothetical protein